jgi:hypothetical protein
MHIAYRRTVTEQILFVYNCTVERIREMVF